MMATSDGLGSDSVLAIYEDKEGILWVGTRGGISRIREGKISSLTKENGLSDNTIKAIFEDNEGSLWLGTSFGLCCVRDGHVVTLGRRNGLPEDFIRSVYQDSHGGFWIGTHGSGLVHLESDRLRTLTIKDGLPSGVLRCSLEDRKGRLWIGTVAGLCCLENGRMRTFGVKDGLSNDYIRVIFGDRKGRLWIGTNSGLNYLEGGKFNQYPFSPVLQPLQIYGIYEEKDGSLWLGNRLSVIRITGEGYQVFDSSNGFSVERAYTIIQDKQDRIWIGMSNGLCLYKDGRFRVLNKKDGLPDNHIYHIFLDPADNLWMSSNRGIFSLSLKDILDYMDQRTSRLHPVTLGLEDGMKSTECNGGSQPTACLSRDGRIYIPTMKGIAIVDPGQRKKSNVIPPVMIEEIIADDQDISAVIQAELVPGTERIEFHYAALSFAAPEKVRFKYKLEGMDKDWIDAGNRREAYYTNIAPGNYTFRVIAANRDGIWNTTGASYFFSQRPFFYQTNLFYILVLLGVFLAGSGISLMRMSRLKRKEKELAALVEARTEELAKANSELERMAKTDGLTEVANRRSFMELIETEWKRAERHAQPLSLIMIDVDHFKLYNDHYGHQAGDEALKRIAAVLRDNVKRAGDMVARYGGEEFVILLCATDRSGVAVLAERIRTRVEELRIPHELSAISRSVTISLGVATADRGFQENPSSLVAAADGALYSAKEGGRNRVCTAWA